MMDRPDRGPADSDAPSDTAGSSGSTPSGAKSKKATTKPSKKTADKKSGGKAAGKASAKSAGKKSAGKASRKSPGGGPTDDEIRQRAYEIHEKRGAGHGLDEDDWHQAERELRARKKQGTPEK